MDYNYLKTAYLEGKSVRVLGKELGLSPSAVSRELKKIGVTLRTKAESQALHIKSNGHPRLGKKHTDESKQAIGNKILKAWEEKSEEEKEKFSERAKKNYEKHGIELKKAGHKGVRLSSKRGSKLEKYIENYLRDKNIEVQFHKNMLTNERLEVDMYIPEYKTCIEINGPSHYEPIRGEAVLLKQQRADLEKMGLITQAGFLYIRVKNVKPFSIVRYRAVCDRIYEQLVNPDFDAVTKKYAEIEV
jgi:very-short-patch-repair endonuclease